MAVFAYKARNGSGALISGALEALSEDDLLRKLQALNYMPVRVSLEDGSQESIPWKALFPPKVKNKDIVMLNMKLAYMAEAGIALFNSVLILAVQVENPLLKDILLDVSQKVFEGSSLSDALSNHPAVFSQMYISMVKVGEISGTLHIVLNRMAAYMEKEEELKQKVQGALFYPMILLGAGCIVVVLIVTFVIPQFVSIFTKANVTLPLPTLILYYFGEFLKLF